MFLEFETEYSLFQVGKDPSFFKFKDIQDFVKKYDELDRFKYTTDVFSYYFLKTALLCNLSEVLQFIYTYCDGFKMPTNTRHKKMFINIIFESALDLELSKNTKIWDLIQNKEIPMHLKN